MFFAYLTICKHLSLCLPSILWEIEITLHEGAVNSHGALEGTFNLV